MKIILLTTLTLSFLYSTDLASQYREMMRATQVEKKVKTTSTSAIEKELRKKYQNLASKTVPRNADGSINMHSKEFRILMDNYEKERRTYKNKPKQTIEFSKIKNDNYIKSLKEIQSMKQDTFESSKEFNERRSSAISILEKRINPLARQGSKEFSVGTVNMKNYDADKEEMQLSLKWIKEIQEIFPETKKLKIVSLEIPRNQAKHLFSKQNKHNFHIGIDYAENKINIKKIIIYDRIIEVKSTEWIDGLVNSFFN